jgi:urease accessory protein
MRKIVEKISASVPATVAVTLEHADRLKSRGLLRLDDGSEAALILERGSALRHGDRLLADDGLVIAVEAAREGLSIITSGQPLDLTRAAYHLGNRHIALQIEASRLAYLHDHVLDDMVRELGFQVSFASERFEPEAGAYGGRGEHAHAHRHSERSRASSVPPHEQEYVHAPGPRSPSA